MKRKKTATSATSVRLSAHEKLCAERMSTLIIGLIAGGFIGYAYKDEISNAIESIRSHLK